MESGSLFDRRAEELNAAHRSIAITSEWTDSMHQHVISDENLRDYLIQDIYLGDVRYMLNGNLTRSRIAFTTEQDSAINTYTVIDRLQVVPHNPIILPFIFRINGFRAGNEIEFQSAGTTHLFTIYGFYETVFFGSPMTGMYKAFVMEEAMVSIAADNNLRPATLISLRYYDVSAAGGIFAGFESGGEDNFTFTTTFSVSLSSARHDATIFAIIMASVLSLIALIIVAIALIVARFSIINNIEQDIQTLGALKSIGFTTRQIIRTIILQFLFITLAGVLLGVVSSIALMGVVGNMIAATSGLRWGRVSMILPIIIAIVAVIGLITGVTYLIARRSKKITPINALRAGLNTHSFQKSATALDTSTLPLSASMAAKQFKTGFKRNIASFITLTLFAFLNVLSFTLYHNFVRDTSAYRQMVGFETAQLHIFTSYDEFAQEQFDNIAARNNVRATLRFSSWSLTVNGESLPITIWEDIGAREISTIVEGRHPNAANEISLAIWAGAWLGVGVGGMVDIEASSGVTVSFMVTGLYQGWGAGGNLTLAGFGRIQENPVLRSMYIYLYDGSDESINRLSNELIADYGRMIGVVNHEEAFRESLAQMQDPIEVATFAILFVIIAVTVLVLFLMIGTIINRSKKETGILKAIGFTSKQLIAQMLLSFLPLILGGVLIGTILGIFVTNPLLGVMFSGIGIARASFIIVPWLVALGAVLLIAASIVTLLLVSLKYKRISARELIVEG